MFSVTNSNNTIFTQNITGQNSVFLSPALQSGLELSFFSKLANLITTINTLFYQYSTGNFQSVSKTLTLNVYNSLSSQLGNIQQNAAQYPDFENIRMSTTRALEGLYQAVQQHGVLMNTQTNLEEMTSKAAILNNMSDLKEYINTYMGSRSIFPNSNVTVVQATLKPQYAEYIRLYGLPEAGIFEMDKLAMATKSAMTKGLM